MLCKETVNTEGQWKNMISYVEAKKIIESQKIDAPIVELPLDQATGHVLAEALNASVASPAFTNSAMDGFAGKHIDLSKPLRVLSTIYATKTDPNKIPAYETGCCVRIMTGGVLPAWADTVIPVENTEEKSGQIFVKEIPSVGANIRTEGEDIASGSRLLNVGMRLTAERIMVAAALGVSNVRVFMQPRLYFISTGDELKAPGETLGHGEIYNSSQYFLRAAAIFAGISDATYLTVSDDKDAAAEQIREILSKKGPKIIISTGAVSAGVADFIPALGQDLDFQPLFHKVAMRPGKPVYLARRNDAVWLGLPGNPISTCTGWYFFAMPLLQSLVGVRALHLYNFKLNNDVRKPEHLRCFFRAEIRDNRAWVPQSQGSGHFASSINQDAFVILPEGMSLVKAETIVPGIFIS
jgi:molybdopterin molybdotransferase